MPEEGVKLTPNSDILSSSEIIRLSRLFIKQGVTKIRLTGGEPTVRKDIVQIVGNILWYIRSHIQSTNKKKKKKVNYTKNINK